MSCQVVGTKGTAQLREKKKGLVIKGEAATGSTTARRTTCTRSSTTSCSPRIRSGQPINNGEYMAKSTLLAIMGRMAAYTGQTITWDMAMNSKEDLSPEKYDWDAKLRKWEVAVPGKTKFV